MKVSDMSTEADNSQRSAGYNASQRGCGKTV